MATQNEIEPVPRSANNNTSQQRAANVRPAQWPTPSPLVAPEAANPTFPLGNMGAVMKLAIEAISETAQVPPEMAAQSVLAVAALAVQGHYDAFHPATRHAPCSLMLLTIAESGARKSTSDKLASAFLQDQLEEARETYKREYGRWRNQCDAREAKRQAVKNLAKGKSGLSADQVAAKLDEIGEDPERPLHPKRIFSEANTEGLLKFMEHAHGSLAWLNNEAGQVLAGTGFSDDNKVKFGATLNSLWDGGEVDRLRSGDGDKEWRHRRLTTHLMVQPLISERFWRDPHLVDSGLFSRCLITKPPSLIGQRRFREVDQAKHAQRVEPFQNSVLTLIRRPQPHRAKANEMRPKTLPWADDARRLWIDFHDEIEAKMAPEGPHAPLRGFGSKIAENVARIATVLQIIENESAAKVEAHTMFAAIEIGRFYLAEAARLHEAAIADEGFTLAEELRRWLEQSYDEAFVSLRVVQQRGPAGLRKDVNRLKRVFEILVDTDWLKRPVPAQVVGRQCRQAYELHPKLRRQAKTL